MTIAEFMSKCREQDCKLINTKDSSKLYSDGMAECCEIWDNDACKGYFIHAAQSAGLDNKTIKSVLNEMRWSFDFKTVDEAIEIYKTF